ncbi:MAG: insulinase family protein [Acidobacteria bacterium]|nr:insulinase family protein [Acidobacteriota bacterium]
MKARRLFLCLAWSCLVLLCVAGGTAPAAAGERAASKYFTLDNGLQVLLQEKRDLPLTGMALAIDLGTKDESAETSGYAHLFEHMLLFGSGGGMNSESRLAELRRHGVAHNAHTDHDLMTFEVSCPGAESAWALEQMRQAVFFAELDPRQLESEKRIINEEILQLRDEPAFLGRLLLMEQLFAGHPYGRPVYGDGSTIRAATVETLRAFCAPRLVPGRCALSVIGDFTLAAMEEEVRRNWGALARAAAPAAEVPPPARLEKNSERQIELDVQESHLFIGWLAPDFNDEQRLPFSLLTHILGGGLNPLLNSVLRGNRLLADRVNMSYAPMRSGGMAVLHVTLKEKDIRAAKGEVASFMGRVSSFNFSKEDVLPRDRMYVLDYLESAKNQMEYGNGSFRESTLNLSVACSRYLLLNRTPVRSSYLESVDKVSSSAMRRAAGKFLGGRKWALLAITPLRGETP